MNKKTLIIFIIVLIVVVGIVWWMRSRPTAYAPAGPAPAAPAVESPQAIQQELEAVNLEDVDGSFQSIDADLNTL